MSESRSPGFQSPVESLFGEDFNLGLFIHIFRQNLIWLVLLAVTAFSLATLFLRYQVPEYQATSTLLLKQKNSPNLIDIEDLLEANTDQAIEQEIEIIKSTKFITQALADLPLDWVQYNQGNVLASESYRIGPLKIEPYLLDSTFVNREVSIIVEDDLFYRIAYSYNGEQFRERLQFGKLSSTPAFNLTVSPASIPIEELKTMNLFLVFRDPEVVRAQIARRINIGLVNQNAGKMAISFRDSDQHKALDIVTSVAQAIIAYEYTVKSESAGRVIQFLDDQIDTLNKELLASETELRRFKEANKLIDPIVEQEYLRNQFVSLDERVLELDLEQATLDWLQAYVDDTLNNVATILPPKSEFIDFTPYVTTLSDLQAQRRNIKSSLSETDIRVVVLDEQIEQVREDFRDGLDNAREKLTISKDYLDRQILINDEEYGRLPIKEAEFVRLTRLNEIREKFYLLLLERRAEFEVARAGLVSDYIILEDAKQAELVTVGKSYIQLAAVAFGTFLGLCLILARYMFHNTVSSLRDIEKHCKSEVIGVVPRYREALKSLATVINNNPKSLVSESFRAIRTNIEFTLGTAKSSVIAITSTVSGEGKTFIISNLAIVNTLLGKRVVIVDLDLRKPKVHKLFKVDVHAGASTVLLGKDSLESALIKTEIKNLDILPAGPIPPNPAELIAQLKKTDLLGKLREDYDVVLIDTPPVGLVADALDILISADLAIYVVRVNYSNRSFIKNINTLVEDKSMNNLRIILNDAGVGGGYGSGGYGLGYGYGYGYGYGSYYRYPYSGYGYGYYSDSPKKAKWYRRLFGGSTYE